MFGQTFQSADLGTIAFLVLLEALLSADNALVLALCVKHLSRDDQKKALFYGLGGAFVLRTLAILLAAYIINFWWLQLAGALYLLYLPISHFVKSRAGEEDRGRKGKGFWPTVVRLNLIDTAFALDSVIVAIAVVDTFRHSDKLWVVVVGALVGIVLLRFAANAILRLLERFPRLDHVAYLLVGWAGLKLLFIAGHTFEKANRVIGFDIPEMPPLVFWAGMALIVAIGSFAVFRRPPAGPSDEPSR